jgi:hypothetical protein
MPRIFRLSRSFLAYALPAPSPALGALRGRQQDSTVLFADEHEGNPLTLTVQRQFDTNWRMSVVVAAPISGWLVLTLGGSTFRARFDAHGQAVVSDVPDTLLSASDGPDLVVGIVPDQPTAPGA